MYLLQNCVYFWLQYNSFFLFHLNGNKLMEGGTLEKIINWEKELSMINIMGL